MRKDLIVYSLIAGLSILSFGYSVPAFAATGQKKFTDAEKGKFRDECRAENKKTKAAKQVVGACVRRKMGKE